MGEDPTDAEPEPASSDPKRLARKRMRQGIASVLVGIGAVILANETKLTTTELLTGGFVLKDEYRQILLFAGIGLAVLGALLAVLSAAPSAEPSAVAALASATGVLFAMTVVGGALVYAAYRNMEAQRGQATAPSPSTETTQTTTTTVPETQTETTPEPP